MRDLVLVLGDQLDKQSAAFEGFGAEHDAVWMAEADQEALHQSDEQFLPPLRI